MCGLRCVKGFNVIGALAMHLDVMRDVESVREGRVGESEMNRERRSGRFILGCLAFYGCEYISFRLLGGKFMCILLECWRCVCDDSVWCFTWSKRVLVYPVPRTSDFFFLHYEG